MRFMILIQSDESQWLRMTAEEKGPVYDAHARYSAELRAAGAFVAGDSLHPSARAARISVRDGRRSVVDGPFTEAKELVGGYYVIEVGSREEAVEWAARCPAARFGTVELRQLEELP
jgi:hypothetical protein